MSRAERFVGLNWATGESGNLAMSSPDTAEIPFMHVAGQFVGGRPVLVMFAVAWSSTAAAIIVAESFVDGRAPVVVGTDNDWAVSTGGSGLRGVISATFVLPQLTPGPHRLQVNGGVNTAGAATWFQNRRYLHVVEL